MPASEIQRQVYRDKFRTFHNEAFQAWCEELLQALHAEGDFQAVRKTSGDGGLDGFVISEQHVYQVYGPARIAELSDPSTATKILTDFAKAHNTLGGQLRAWTFIHNHPEGKIGKQSVAAVARLQADHLDIEVSVLNIDSLWGKLASLPDALLSKLFGSGAENELKAKLRLAQDCIRLFETEKAEALFREVLFRASSDEELNSQVTALLGLFVLALNRRDQGEAAKYLRKAEGLLVNLKDDGLRVHVLRAKANLLDNSRSDVDAETAYREALAVPIAGSDDYFAEAQIATKVDLALFYCRTKKLELAEPLVRECEAFVGGSTEMMDGEFFLHTLDAAISYALCVGDKSDLVRGVSLLEEKATSKSLAARSSHLLQKLGLRAGGLKANDLGVICCDAAVRLGKRASRDDDVIAAEHTAAVLLYEKGDLEAAKARCDVLLPLVRAGEDRVLQTAVAQIAAAIAHKLGDYDLAISASEYALQASGDDILAAAMARHGLAESLCGAGRVRDGLEEARTAYSLAKNADVPPEFLHDLLFLMANAGCLLGDWSTTDRALAEMATVPESSQGSEVRRKHLIDRIEACRQLRGRFEVLSTDPKPLETAGTADSNTVQEANTVVVRSLVDWWTEAPGNEVPQVLRELPESRYPKNLSVLYDYWGRGNMSRVLLNLHGFGHALNVTLEVRSLEEVKRAIRVFALFTDVLLLLWKGPVWSKRVVPVVPAFNGIEGGAGYTIFPTDPTDYQRKTERSGDWFPAVGYGTFLPDEVIAFLFEEALPLVRQGRVLVVPASAVACIHEGHGPFESLFAELCAATPILSSDPARSEFPIGWVPYFPEAPFAVLAEIIHENPEALRRLRLLLLRRTRELKATGESFASSKELEVEIADALAQLKDFQIRLGRKSGWDVDAEAMADSSVTFGRDELFGAAWRHGAGSYLYSYGRPETAVGKAEWMPVFTLQNLGYRWQVAATSRGKPSGRGRKGPDPDEAVGAWLVPRGQDIQVALLERDESS